MSAAPTRDDGIKPEHEQESHISPSTTIPALTRDKTPATTSNLLSWFRHPLATFTASLKRRRCASFGDGENDPAKPGRKKKVEIVGDDCKEEIAKEAAAAAEAMALQEKAPGSSHGPAGGAGNDHELLDDEPPVPKPITTAVHVAACINDEDAYVKKEEMAIGKQEKVKAKEQQGSSKFVVEKEWLRLGQPIDITSGNNHKVVITSPSKQPESAPITIKEASAAHPVATGIEDAAENAEEAVPAPEDTVTAVSAMRKIK